MDKNWLIRTKGNQIIGPVSRTKAIEILESDTLSPDDELCSGNGYWFYVRERELVQKYLIDGAKQAFDPVSEALEQDYTQPSPDVPDHPSQPKVKETAPVNDTPTVQVEASPGEGVTKKSWQASFLKGLLFSLVIGVLVATYFRHRLIRGLSALPEEVSASFLNLAIPSAMGQEEKKNRNIRLMHHIA